MNPTRMKQLLRNIPKAQLLAILGGTLSSILGLTVMFGWYTYNVVLIQISAAFVPMQINTALGFLMSGLGLLLIIKGHHRAGMACGIFVMLVGLLTLVEYIFGLDLGIDQLLMQHYITVETSFPDRMAPNTALCFLLTGAAQVVLGSMVKVWKPCMIVSILGSLIFGLGFIALAGYAVGFEAAYGWMELTRMAIHTAGGFMIIGVAVISLAWHLTTPKSSNLPSWFPLPVGIAVMTIMISLWQALEYHATKLIKQYDISGNFFFVNDALLIVGIVLAAALSITVFLYQAARNRERDVETTNRGLAIEISNRKVAENALQESEKRFRGLFENSVVSVWHEDMSEVRRTLDKLRSDGVRDLRQYLASNKQAVRDIVAMVKVIHVNKATMKLFAAKTEDEFIHQIDKTFGSGAIDVFVDELCAIWNGEKSFQSETTLRTLDGEDISAIVTFQIPGAEDSFQSIPVSIIDITERKQAEKTLRGVSQQLQTSIDRMPIAYILWDDRFRVTEWNQTAEKIFGYSKNEMLGQHAVDYIVPEPARSAVQEVIEKLLAGEEADYSKNGNNLRKDGTIITCKWYNISLQNETGDTVAILSMVIDITDRNRIEEERNKLLHNNEERVKEITCLYVVTESIQRRATLEEIFQDAATAIPTGWHYPDITRSKVAFDGQEYVSEPFEETEWHLSSSITVNGEPQGSVEVYYLEECPELDEGPFMKEERNLLNELAIIIGKAIEYKQAEDKLNKTNRLFAILSQANQAIVREHDEQKLFQEICDIVIETGKFRLAWIGLLDEEKQSVKSVALSGEGSDYLQQNEISLGNDLTGKGTAARSILEGKSVVLNDLRNNPDSVPCWCAQIVGKECLAAATFPLRSNDSTIGTLNVCSRESRHFDDDEISLLEEMTLDISFALETFKKDEKLLLAAIAFESHEAITITDSEANIVHVNNAFTRITGFSEEEVIGKNPRIFQSGRQDAEFYQRMWADLINTGYWEGEIWNRRKNGDIYLEYLSITAVYNKDGKVTHYIGHFLDITERKQAEKEIARFSQIIEDSLNEIYLFDVASLKFVQVNRAAQLNLGYSMEEFRGMTPVDIKPEFTADSYAKLLVPLRKGEKEKLVFETVHRRKDKSLYDVEVHVQLLRHEQEALFVTTTLDITDKKKQEAILNQAQKMEAVGQLTGGIAHDFNNLLSIISGNLRFLREDLGETSEDIDELFEDAISAVDDGAELTQRLLGFSRTKVLHPEYRNVNDIIEQSVRFLSRTLVENTDLETVLPDETLFTNVDPSQLENALLNLCINARDAMPEGGPITISAERYHHGSDDTDDYSLSIPEGDYVKISVTDTGSGINPEDMQHVYEPFYTTKDIGKGSGLGLSMVFGFTQQSQGACHIDSTLGEGTTVSMVFPEVVEQRDMDQTPEDAEELPADDSK